MSLRAVAVPAARVSAARSSSTAVSAGYVPDGLTAKQWEDMKKKKEVAAAKRKKEVASKKFEVGLWLGCTRGCTIIVGNLEASS